MAGNFIGIYPYVWIHNAIYTIATAKTSGIMHGKIKCIYLV